MRIFANGFLVFAIMALMLPIEIFGCACCAERGTYSVSESEFDDYLERETGQIGLKSSVLYTDAGYPESIIGIDPLGESFNINGRLSGKAWTLNLTDDTKRTGSITLWRPKNVEVFEVDRTPLVERPTVTLYKEMRFGDRVQSATGFLKDGVDSETRYRLVLQGEGNRCTMASDFATYFLQVKGKSADYLFFGELRTGMKSIAQTGKSGPGQNLIN